MASSGPAPRRKSGHVSVTNRSAQGTKPGRVSRTPVAGVGFTPAPDDPSPIKPLSALSSHPNPLPSSELFFPPRDPHEHET
jgi:hypothetical protein